MLRGSSCTFPDWYSLLDYYLLSSADSDFSLHSLLTFLILQLSMNAWTSKKRPPLQPISPLLKRLLRDNFISGRWIAFARLVLPFTSIWGISTVSLREVKTVINEKRLHQRYYLPDRNVWEMIPLLPAGFLILFLQLLQTGRLLFFSFRIRNLINLPFPRSDDASPLAFNTESPLPGR